MAEAFSSVDLPQVRGELLEIRPGRHLSVAHQPGQAQADTVVFFCHGAGGNKDQWRHLWQALGEEGYGLVAWDLLGHGASDKPRRSAAYAWAELVADYLELLRRFGGRRNLIVAHSFGTGLSMSALLQSQAVSGALLLGSQLHRPLSRGGLMALPAWVLELIRPVLAKGFRQRAWHPAADRQLVAYEEKITENNRLYVFKGLLEGVQWPDAGHLASLRLPIEVLCGDSDGLTPASGGEALARQLPQAGFEVLRGCGHQLMLEKPRQVLEAFGRLRQRLDSV
ncbi:alpha/beta fold hydrolase [Pseudomonas asplenii]|uniref:alpha/beta fold hydrolase n=1 Tax=Pseudomonas asplenii TaxID=53407 RepID=UPI002361F932|nr:alpha/beta hydrolase [Pseudomonas asplenii]